MSDYYPFLVILHLLCAVTFGGAVIFEVLILESLHKRFSHDMMRTIEAGIVERAKRLMPWVVGTLFITGIAMLHIHFPGFSGLLDSSFGRLLSIKIGLAGIVLICFLTALGTFTLGRMTPRLFKLIHLTVFSCVIGIIILAKAMFYF